MELLLTLLGILKYLIIGFAAVTVLKKARLFRADMPQVFSVVFSFLFGLLVSVILLHIGLFTNLLNSVFLATWVLALFCAIYLIIQKVDPLLFFKTSLLPKALFLLGYFVQVVNLSLQPVIANDARGIWLLKSKAILAGATAFSQYLQNPLYNYSHTDYPITMPLLYADLVAPLRHFWEPAIGIFSFTCFFFILLAFYGIIRYFTRAKPVLTIIVIAVLFFTPEYTRQAWAGLSDVPLSLTFLGTLLAILFANIPVGLIAYLPALSIAGLSATIKNEGQTFLLFTLVALGIVSFTKFVKEKFNAQYLWFIIPVLPVVLWKLYIAQYAITNDLLSAPNLTDIIWRIPTMISEIAPRLLDGYRFGILIVPALLLCFLPTKSTTKTRNVIGGIVVAQALMYLLIYLITPHDLVWHISTSFSRLLLHLLPSIFLIAIYSRSAKNTV